MLANLAEVFWIDFASFDFEVDEKRPFSFEQVRQLAFPLGEIGNLVGLDDTPRF